jgi:hypothetical protein
MEFNNRRLAAAAYDRARDARRSSVDRVLFVGVELAPGRCRTLLGDVALDGDPPEVLRAALAETLAALRVIWLAFLTAEDEPTRAALEAAHAALQCEMATTEWTWSADAAEGYALGRTLARRREELRQAIARPAPDGAGVLLPMRARACEPLPRVIADAWSVLDGALGGMDRMRRTVLRDVAYAIVGAWRLREMDEVDAAALIEACAHGDIPAPASAPASVEGVFLRAAS